LGNANGLGANTNALSVDGGTLNLATFSQTVGGLSGSAGTLTTTSAANVTFTTNSASNATFSGQILNGSGTLSLVKGGAGTEVLTGVNTYSGSTTVNGGVLLFNSLSAIGGGTASNITVAFGGAVAVGYPMDQTFLGRITPASSGSVALAVDSGNTLDFSSAGANLQYVSFGAVGAANFNGTLIPSGTTWRLGGGGGVLTFNPVLNDVNGPTSLIVNGSGTGGTVVLTNANSYTGGTRIAAGTLSLANSAAIPAGTSITFTGGVLQHTASNTVDYSTNIVNSTAAVTIDTNGVAVNYAGVIAASNTAGLTKIGAGTLTLGAANAYLGNTTILGGTLAGSTDNALPTATAVTFGDSTGNTGGLDLTAANQTVASLAFRSNSATPDTITIGSGKTLTVNGTGGVSIGPSPAADNYTTNVTMSGPGSLVVSNTAATVNFGTSNTNQNNTGGTFLSDLSGLGSFSANVATFNVGFGTRINSTLLLSNGSNSITAATIRVGDSNLNNGGPELMVLGTGVNTLNADTITVGISKVSATMDFASQAPASAGSLTIGGKSGPAANITLGSNNGAATSAQATGILDLRGHVATVTAGSLTLGVGSNTSSGGQTGIIDFDTGTFTATNIALGGKSGAGGGGLGSGVINLSGGAMTVLAGSADSFVMATAGTIGSATGLLNINGGIFTSNVNITKGGGNNTTATITVNGGTLDMEGNAIGGALAIDNLNFQSGGLMNVGQIDNGSSGLVKTTAGLLTLSGTGSYTAGTTVADGTLLVTNSQAIADGTNLTVGVATMFPAAVVPSPAVSAGPAAVAVPEPGTIALLAAGVTFFVVYRRRRQK
jgi:autotransporter-associated beta strand protein